MKKTLMILAMAVNLALLSVPVDVLAQEPVILADSVTNEPSIIRASTISAVVLKPLDTGLEEMRQTAWDEAQAEHAEELKKNGGDAGWWQSVWSNYYKVKFYLEHLTPKLDAAYEQIGSEVLQAEGIPADHIFPYGSDHRVLYLELNDQEKEKLAKNEHVLKIEELKAPNAELSAKEKLNDYLLELMQDGVEEIPVSIVVHSPLTEYTESQMQEEASLLLQEQSIERYKADGVVDPIKDCKQKTRFKIQQDAGLDFGNTYDLKDRGIVGIGDYVNVEATLTPQEIIELVKLPEVNQITAHPATGNDMWTTESPTAPVAATQNPTAAQQKKGDINGDGMTDIMDVIRLNKALLGIEKLSDAQNAAADADGDGEVTSNDSLALLKQILGIVKQDPVEQTVNLSASYTARAAQTVDIDEQTILGQTKFALNLLRESAKPGENVLVSPYSVSQALGMTANGAAGDTLKEMETVLGGSMDTLNPAFYTLRTNAPNVEYSELPRLYTANSIWVKNDYPVRSDFLQKNADFYAADAFAAPFDDSTKDDINSWVKMKTYSMVPEILDEIPDGVRMYLINAVAFDAKWMKQYAENEVKDGKFTAADGKKQDAKMLYGDEYNYLADDHATGFMKYYQGAGYYFAALLPEKGMTPEAYLETLTPEHLHQMLAEPECTKVKTVMPEFSYDFGALLNEPLQNMGMKQAFDVERADFSGMTDFSFETDEMLRLCINRVLHKTHIEVSPVGTRAGAAAAVEMMTECATEAPKNPKEVVLDRPFVYMIVDTETSLPIFIGTLNSVQ